MSNLECSNPLENKLQEIDVKELEKLVSEKLGHEVQLFSEITTWRGDSPRLKITSPDYAGQSGIMSHIFKTLTIEDFSGGLSPDGASYWILVNFAYDFQSGSNGTTIMDAWWVFDKKKWIVR